MTVPEGETNLQGCQRAIARSQIYGLLSRILSSPNNALNSGIHSDLERVASEYAEFDVLRKSITKILDVITDPTFKQRAIEQEYTKLFVKAEAPPYECSYLPASLISHELADISGFFLAFGLRPHQERQDHIASQLEFMSFLCLKESIARGNGKIEEANICRDAEAKFLRDHLGKWIRIYHRLLSEKTSMPLYPLIVGLVREMVSLDASFLAVAPDEITDMPAHESEEFPGCRMAQ